MNAVTAINGQPDAKYALSQFQSHTNTRPRLMAMSWVEVVELLKVARVSACTLETCGKGEHAHYVDDVYKGCRHKYGPAWSPAMFAPGTTRASANVTEISMLGVDVDHVTDDELAEVWERLARYRYVAHSTHSDRPGDRCVRPVLALSRPVTREEWPRFWPAAMRVLGMPADEQCKNPDRLYFLSSRPTGADYLFVEHDGEPIDVDAILAMPPEIVEREPSTRSTSTTIATGDDVFTALASLDQGYVLTQISGTRLVNGETITLGRTIKGKRAIIVDGKATAGYIDAHGKIAHASTSDARPNGGPTASTWCRYYDHTDKEIRRMLIEHVPELARFGETKTKRSNRNPAIIGIGLESENASGGNSSTKSAPEYDLNEPPPFDDVPPPSDDDAPKSKRAHKQKGDGAVRIANDYIAKFAAHDDGVTLRRWRGDWYRWFADRGHFTCVSDERIDASLYRDLKLGRRQDVGDVRHALIAVDDVLIDEVEIGGWIGEPPVAHNPLDLAACPNGLLHLPTRTLTPATPRYFATTALGVPYTTMAPGALGWMKFLKQLWPNDPESIAALQEWFGYMLTPDTRQQKILLLVGPKRSGKGTIMRILTALETNIRKRGVTIAPSAIVSG